MSLHKSLGLLFLAAPLAGCGGGGSDTADQPPATTPAASATGTASITGRITFGGEAPEAEVIRMSADPKCKELHPDGLARAPFEVGEDGGVGGVVVYLKGVAGKVTLEGAAPAQEPIQMAADPNCARMHTAPVRTEFVVVGEGGALANGFVYLKSGVQGDFPPPEAAVVLDQQGCVYHPHVIGIQVGQPLEIVNSDETLHNIHPRPKKNEEFNVGQPREGMTTTKSFSQAELLIPVGCDVHPWVRAYISVFDHPFFVVTAADGSYTISDLPAGDYEVEAIHPALDAVAGTVSVADGASASLDLAYGGGGEAAASDEGGEGE